MTWLLNVLGALLVLIALRDIFHTLWHPHGFGSLGRQVFALVWRASRLARPTELAGPVGLLLVVGTWAAMIVAGWTLVYLPHMPEQFNFGSPLEPAESSDLISSLYLSLVAVGTLGFGDITPAHAALRLLAPLQALMGFVLFTAAISWVLQVYPALTRRRALAKSLDIMARNDTTGYVGTGDPSIVTQLLQSTLSGLMSVRMDLVQYGETYYFREDDPEVSLAANLPYALDLAEAGKRSASSDVRHVAALLDEALTSVARTVEEYVGPCGSVEETLEAFAADHRQHPNRA